jgi:hypothetical protein
MRLIGRGLELGPGRQIEPVSRLESVVPGSIPANVVVDGDPARPNHLEDILPNEQCSIVIDTDAEDVRMRIDDVHQLGVPFGRREMWVDGNILGKAEAGRPSGRHQQRLVGPATHGEGPLNDRAGRSPEDHAATIEKLLERGNEARAEIRIGEATGVSSRQKDAGRGLQWRHERLVSASLRSRV